MTYSTIQTLLFGKLKLFKGPNKSYYRLLTIFLLSLTITAAAQQPTDPVKRITERGSVPARA